MAELVGWGVVRVWEGLEDLVAVSVFGPVHVQGEICVLNLGVEAGDDGGGVVEVYG